MHKFATHASAQFAEKVVMFRVDTAKRFQKQPDSSWLVPIICEGAAGGRFAALIRLRTTANPSKDNFWSEANIACRNLRSHRYSLIKDGESTALYRQTESEVLDAH